MNVVERAKAPTPKFFKVLRTIGLALLAVSGSIVAAPVALPAVVVMQMEVVLSIDQQIQRESSLPQYQRVSQALTSHVHLQSPPLSHRCTFYVDSSLTTKTQTREKM